MRPWTPGRLAALAERLRRRFGDTLVWGYVAFLFIITLAPFRLAKDPHKILKHLRDADWIPYLFQWDFYSGSDILLNLFIFFLLGAFLAGRFLHRERRFPARRDLAAMVGMGFAVSLAIETLQLFTYDRTTSSSDLLNNTLGTWLGATAVVALWRRGEADLRKLWIRIWRDRVDLHAATAMTAILAACQFAPYNFHLNVARFTHRLEVFLANPWAGDWRHLSDSVVILLLMTLTGYYLGRDLRTRRTPIAAPARMGAGVGIVAVLMAGLEFGQLILDSRLVSLQSLGIGIGGGLAGIAGAAVERRQPDGSGAERAAILSVLSLLYLSYFAGALMRLALWQPHEGNLAGRLVFLVHPTEWLFVTPERIFWLLEIGRAGITFFLVGAALQTLWRRRGTAAERPAWYTGLTLVAAWGMATLMAQGVLLHITMMVAAVFMLRIGILSKRLLDWHLYGA